MTKAQIEQAKRILESSDSIQEARERCHKSIGSPQSERQFRAFCNKFLGGPPSAFFLDTEGKQDIAELQREVARLGRQLRVAQEESLDAKMIKRMLNVMATRPLDPPAWLAKKPSKPQSFHGVPTLFLSDIHHGERVFAAEVDGVNRFDTAISRARLERVFERATYILEHVFSPTEYPGIVLALGGDMVSGTIHEELRETNEVSIFEAVLDLADILAAGIELLAERFGRVFVPCVVGNHGRLDRKPKAKHGPHDNFEWILYHYLARGFEDDDRVTFRISDSFTCHYRVYNTRYLLTHGDCFRGGSGISGAILPWTLGEHRMRKQMQTMQSWTDKPVEYDILMFGHWHQYFPARSFVANGSLKGFDEYAKRKCYGFEPPQQALWITSPEYGMTFNAPVYAEAPPKKGGRPRWVSLPAG